MKNIRKKNIPSLGQKKNWDRTNLNVGNEFIKFGISELNPDPKCGTLCMWQDFATIFGVLGDCPQGHFFILLHVFYSTKYTKWSKIHGVLNPYIVIYGFRTPRILLHWIYFVKISTLFTVIALKDSCEVKYRVF